MNPLVRVARDKYVYICSRDNLNLWMNHGAALVESCSWGWYGTKRGCPHSVDVWIWQYSLTYVCVCVCMLTDEDSGSKCCCAAVVLLSRGFGILPYCLMAVGSWGVHVCCFLKHLNAPILWWNCCVLNSLREWREIKMCVFVLASDSICRWISLFKWLGTNMCIYVLA